MNFNVTQEKIEQALATSYLETKLDEKVTIELIVFSDSEY
jgi:hypothetical protein